METEEPGGYSNHPPQPVRGTGLQPVQAEQSSARVIDPSTELIRAIDCGWI